MPLSLMAAHGRLNWEQRKRWEIGGLQTHNGKVHHFRKKCLNKHMETKN